METKDSKVRRAWCRPLGFISTTEMGFFEMLTRLCMLKIDEIDFNAMKKKKQKKKTRKNGNLIKGNYFHQTQSPFLSFYVSV